MRKFCIVLIISRSERGAGWQYNSRNVTRGRYHRRTGGDGIKLFLSALNHKQFNVMSHCICSKIICTIYRQCIFLEQLKFESEESVDVKPFTWKQVWSEFKCHVVTSHIDVLVQVAAGKADVRIHQWSWLTQNFADVVTVLGDFI